MSDQPDLHYEIHYRDAVAEDAPRLSILFSQVYIHSYGLEGVSTEFSNYIHKQFATERISNTIVEHPGTIIVATYNNNLVGVAEIVFDALCPVGNLVAPELNKLYILHHFSGLGIGAVLLERVERYLIQNGYKELWLWVWLPNERAQKFYQQHQYVPIGRALYQMDTNTYENVVMWKHL